MEDAYHEEIGYDWESLFWYAGEHQDFNVYDNAIEGGGQKGYVKVYAAKNYDWHQ